MRQLLFGGLLAAAVLLGRSAGPHTATAQPPKDDKKATAAGVIEIAQGKDDKFCAARRKLERAWIAYRDVLCDLPYA